MFRTALRGKLILLIGLAAIFASGALLSSVGQDNLSSLALEETRKAYERGREMYFDENLGTNGKSCHTCHPDGFMTRAESYPRYKHILRTIATVSITHNFAIVAESAGTPWELGSEDANALALYVTWLSNGKKLQWEEPHTLNKEWIKKGKRLFDSSELGGNGAACADCHSKKSNAARIKEPIDLKGIVAYYPKFRPHFGRVVTLEQQINHCIVDTMEGPSLALDDTRIVELYCYLAEISQGTKISVAKDVAK